MSTQPWPFTAVMVTWRKLDDHDIIVSGSSPQAGPCGTENGMLNRWKEGSVGGGGVSFPEMLAG